MINNTFPESLNHIDTDDKTIRTLADYIQYMCERVDFAISSLRKNNRNSISSDGDTSMQNPVKEYKNGAEVISSLPSGTMWACEDAEITLGKGMWLVIANAYFAGGGRTGVRILGINDAPRATGMMTGQGYMVNQNALGANSLNHYDRLNISSFVEVDTQMKLYPMVYQNSGSGVPTRVIIQAIKQYD